MAAIEEEKIKLEREKEKIRIKESLIKEKEKRKRAKRFNEIGRIAFKASIDNLSDDALLGAFMEISENLKSSERITTWENKAKAYGYSGKSSNASPLSVSFEKSPSKQEKAIMKELAFKWNSFRKEFYGYAKEEALRKRLPDSKFTLEVLE